MEGRRPLISGDISLALRSLENSIIEGTRDQNRMSGFENCTEACGVFFSFERED